MSVQIQRRDPPPLPATVVDLEKGRRTKVVFNLNDEVDKIHLSLWDDEEKGESYRALNWATWSSGAVHGSLAFDDCHVAIMIKERAQQEGNRLVASQNLATIHHSWKVVTRRLNQSREQRRYQVDGEIVPDSHNSGTE